MNIINKEEPMNIINTMTKTFADMTSDERVECRRMTASRYNQNKGESD